MSLREGDLRDLVDDVFEVDSYQSKMGDDKNIITISFTVADKKPAEDLANFLEKGYNFILDADVTSGEQADGKYKVFVEIQREKGANANINEMLDGVKKLSAVENFKFRYYKDFHSKSATLEQMEQDIPVDPDKYGMIATESNMNNFKNFFNKSYVDSIEMYENKITIKKKYAEPIRLKFIDFGDTQQTLDSISESFNANDFAEIIFLSKYVGDYNITKYGNKLTFENAGKTLVVERL
jgi:hypothetical protein|tara:strand:- start:562 stop:1275 length:714 start_codon:yes stop_codon:yes gene_type:complete